MQSQPLDLNALATEIIQLAAKLNAATYKWLCLIADFDDRSHWPNGSLESCAQWLQRKCGFGLGAARERLRVAHALRDLPKISAAMARGALGYAKARALTRIATATTEDELLSIALKKTADEVEREVQARRGADQQTNSPTRQLPPICTFTHSWESDGTLCIRARLPAETGKLLLQALDEATKVNAPAKSKASHATAFVALANTLLRPAPPARNPEPRVTSAIAA
jgi:hypothetical protein